MYLLLLLYYLYKIQKKMSIEFFAFIAFFRKIRTFLTFFILGVKNMKKIGIIGAMDVELALLKQNLQNTETIQKAHLTFFQGTLNNISIVVVKCGIGKVNAALCANILIQEFAVTHVINTGIAGSISNKLHILDTVISEDAVYHDVDVTGFGYPPCTLPGFETAFKADSRLIETTKKSFAELNSPHQAFIGRIATGDQFIASSETKNAIRQNCKPVFTEIEGAAIAHAAYLNKIPFVVVRAISDKADNSAEMDYPTFEKAAAGHCAALVMDFIQKL